MIGAGRTPTAEASAWKRPGSSEQHSGHQAFSHCAYFAYCEDSALDCKPKKRIKKARSLV